MKNRKIFNNTWLNFSNLSSSFHITLWEWRPHTGKSDVSRGEMIFQNIVPLFAKFQTKEKYNVSILCLAGKVHKNESCGKYFLFMYKMENMSMLCLKWQIIQASLYLTFLFWALIMCCGFLFLFFIFWSFYQLSNSLLFPYRHLHIHTHNSYLRRHKLSEMNLERGEIVAFLMLYSMTWSKHLKIIQYD